MQARVQARVALVGVAVTYPGACGWRWQSSSPELLAAPLLSCQLAEAHSPADLYQSRIFA